MAPGGVVATEAAVVTGGMVVAGGAMTVGVVALSVLVTLILHA